MSTILVTGVGGPVGRALGAQLAERVAAGADLSLVGVDVIEIDDPSFPVTDLAPWPGDPDYARGMRALVEKHSPDLVIPTVTDELPEAAVLAEALGLRTPKAHPAVVVCGASASAVAADKLLTMWLLSRAGVPVPRFAPATDFADAAAAVAWGEGPVVLKPRVSRGGRGVRLVERPDDDHWSAAGASWVVQSFAGGVEYSPQLYVSPVTGETTVVVLEKTELKEGRVGNAVSVARLDDGAAPDVVDVARRAAEALDLVGPIDMDVRRGPDGDPLVLEVNARFGAASAQAPELLDAVLAEWLGGEP